MDKKQRFIELGWRILEHKCRYYYFNSSIISDFDYDALEKEYDSLASELGLPPTASDMVDFDENRQACRAVLLKLRRKTFE